MVDFIRLTPVSENCEEHQDGPMADALYIKASSIKNIVSWPNRIGCGIELENGDRYKVAESPLVILKMINPDIH